MKKYIVVQVSVATEENPNFAGQRAEAYYGKDQYLIGYYGDHAEATYMKKVMHSQDIKEHGYDRKCDAKRSYIYKNPENTKYWKSSVEILEYDIHI